MCDATFEINLILFKVIYAKVGALRGAMLKDGGGGVNNTQPMYSGAHAQPCRRERGPQAAQLIHVFSSSDLVVLNISQHIYFLIKTKI